MPTRGARLRGSGRRRVGYPLLTRDVRHSSRSKNADSNAAPALAPARVAGEKMERAEGSGRSGRLGARSPQAAGRCQRGPQQPRFHPAGPGLATRHGHSQQHGQTQAGGPAGPGRLRARRPPPVFRRFLPICFPLPSTRPGVATNRLKQITIISPRSPFFFTLGASASHADILSPGKAGHSGPSGCLPGGQGRGSHGPCVALPGPR